MKTLDKLKQRIDKAEIIAIACHVNPDGDCVGSMLALGLVLSDLGKKVFMISQDGVPRRYKKLPGAGLVKKHIHGKVDLSIAVDCNSKEMLGRSYADIRKAPCIIEIDHHFLREPFGDIRFIKTKVSSIGEMLYELFEYMNIDITEEAAKNLLTSVLVETNSFRLPTVRPETFYMCAELLKKGVDYYKLSEMVYWSKSQNIAVLSGICMAKMKLLLNGALAWSLITRDEIRAQKGKEEDVDAVANDILAIEGVKIAILFRENSDGDLRVSLRSKKRINVALLAKKFGGGGHSDCAGCFIENTEKSIKFVLREAKNLL